jgi:Bladder cancer-related protein BC10
VHLSSPSFAASLSCSMLTCPSWLPLLFIPTNASPIFIFLFFICTYFLNRPCVYCSFLLLILFASSCYWSDHCFFDFSSNWFEPRAPSSTMSAEVVNSSAMSSDTLGRLGVYATALNNTAFALAGTALEEAKRQIAVKTEWTGIGVEWLRSLLGRREWRLPCVDVYIRL